MMFLHKDLSQSPQTITEEPMDCLWVRFGTKQWGKPLESTVLQWVDWKLLGAISRMLLGGEPIAETFLAPGKKLPISFILLEPRANPSISKIIKFCEGTKATRLGIYCSDEQDAKLFEQAFRKQSGDSYPKEVCLITDGGEEKA